MTVSIRFATKNDYAAIAAVSTESQEKHARAHPDIFFSDTSGLVEEEVYKQLENPKYAVQVAELEERIVGYVFLLIHQASYMNILKPRTLAIITDIAVLEAYQGRGIGRMLFEAARVWAKEQSAEELELTVWDFNKSAIAFYEHLGMQTLHRTMALPL